MSSSQTKVVEFDVIDSTNTEAHRRAAAGERGPLWLRADRQEQGRGRSGRPWSSPPGNLAATYLFTPKNDLTVLHQLSFVTGVAAFEAIAPQLREPTALQLKWPNDLLIDGEKVSGILVETSRYNADIVVMIGIGVNIVHAPVVSGRATTHIEAHGAQQTPAQLLGALADSMSLWLNRWDNGIGFPAIRQAWQERAHSIGQSLTVNTNDKRVSGKFAGLADNGALLVSIETGETVRIEHGDVSLADPITNSQVADSQTDIPKERA